MVDSTAPETTTKAELLNLAKAAIAAGEQHLRDAAEALARAQDDFKATQRELAEGVGRSAAWVCQLLKWRASGYREQSPFGPTTKAGRVSHAKQRATSRGREMGSPGGRGHAKSSDLKSMPTTSAEAGPSPQASLSASRNPSPAEAKGNLMYAITHWWPLMDNDGRVEVTEFFFKLKGVRVNAAAA
jgi:hypothetical protein